jgi:hypothetical protein
MTGGWIAGSMALSAGATIYSANKTSKAIKSGAAATLRASREAEALNIERFGEAKELLDPYIGEARTARDQYMIEMGLAPGEANTAYMETGGYQSLLDERQRGAQGAAAETGSLYSGRRIEAAADIGGATQNQFYQNYMNMLHNLGSPGVATNLASLGVGQAATIGQQNLGAQQVASEGQISAAQTQQAAASDIMGAGATMYGSYLSRQPPPLPPPPSTAAYGDAYQPAQMAGYV